MTKVAARYGVSGSFLTRVCDRLNVPRQLLGYWAKVAVGKPVKPIPLPDPQPGHDLEWRRDGAEPTRIRLVPKAPRIDQKKKLIRSKHARPPMHALLVGAAEHFNKGRENHEGYWKPTK